MKAWNFVIKQIVKREGKKNQVAVGDVREIVKIFIELMAENEDVFDYVCLRAEEIKARREG